MIVGALALLPAAAYAQGAIEGWVQRYNGPGNSGDYSMQLAMDTNGNVYVTGGSHGGDPLYGGSSMDYATIKYSSAGVPLWTNYYNGIANGYDSGQAISADASGNVVVTGSEASGASSVIATIKYSSDGIPLWTNRASSGYVYAMTLDTSGNVIVMGAPASYVGCLTLKYSSAGALLWSRTYNDYGRGDGRPMPLAVDPGGNVFVVGATSSNAEYLTIKYSSAGALLWTRRYKGPGTGLAIWADSVAVDASGNVYVTGQSAGTGIEANYDFATIKYSGAGVPLWTNCYNGPITRNECAQAIALDVSGNLYVTGTSYGGWLGDDLTTIKYSSAGVPLWTNRYNTMGGEAVALAVDACGNAYVTSHSGGDYLTFACSSSGVPLWAKRYNGPGNDEDYPISIAVDASGSVYVTGRSGGSIQDSTMADWATVKYVTPAIISRPPGSQTNAVGTTASFTVEAAGNVPLSYQWRRQGTNLLDGGNLSGVTTSNLLITNVQLTDAAGYSVVVTNAYGSATSSVAQLTIYVPPNPGRFTKLSYSPEDGFSFTFRDATLGRPYRIQTSPSLAEGSWVDWMSFTYNGPIALTDLGAPDADQRFYRAVSP